MATYCAKLDRVSNRNIIDNVVRSGLTSADINVAVRGTAFYVDSNTGSANNDGRSWEKALATVDQAVNKCTANKGDVIYVAPGHAETLSAADAIDIDVAGVSVIGLGNGNLRPTFTYDNAAGEIVIGASNVTICNIICNASVTTVLKAIDVEAGANCASIIGCEFGVDAAGTDEFSSSIIVVSTANKALIQDCVFLQGAGGAVSAITIGGSDYATIKNCTVFGDYSTACISNGAEADHVVVFGNLLFNGTIGGNAGLNTEPCIEFAATTTGIIANNYIACNLTTKAASIVAADCYLFENYYNEDEGSAATGGIIGAASADD